MITFLVILPIVMFIIFIWFYLYMNKREIAFKKRIKEVREIAQEHRIRYHKMSDDNEYWKGRRDEAGLFSDLILDAIYLEGAWNDEARKE